MGRQERLVMRHYLLETVHVIMAFECPRKPWNPWIEIHAPLAFDHLPGYGHPSVPYMLSCSLTVHLPQQTHYAQLY